MRLRSDRRLIFIYVSCLLIAGCDDDPMPAQLGAVTGRVTNVRTGEGIPGVTIALVDPVRIVIAGAPAQTGADGSYRIAGVAPGDYTAFYFQPGGFGSFDRSAPKFHVEADRDTRWDCDSYPRRSTQIPFRSPGRSGMLRTAHQSPASPSCRPCSCRTSRRGLSKDSRFPTGR
jgi:hypothetical protein